MPMRTITTLSSWFVLVGLFYISILGSCTAQNLNVNDLSIIAVTPQGIHWPGLFAAEYSGTEAPISKIIFTWTFTDDRSSDQSCTFQGRTGTSPCRGRTVERVYNTAGTWTVTLTANVAGYPAIKKSQSFVVQTFVSTPTVQRQEVRTMSRTSWNNLVAALQRLKALGIYDHFVYLHQVAGITGVRVGSNRNAAHRGPAFLPWHRTFLRHMERTLQVVSGNNQIGIPYWDWTIDQGLPGGPLTSPVWTDTWFGPGGTASNSYIVPSGPFCSQKTASCAGLWPLLPQLSGPNLERELGRYSGSLPNRNQINSINTITVYDSGRYDDLTSPSSSFRDALEGWGGGIYGGAHNIVHVFVGGSMSPLSSPNDPIFFFHHANVDRIWHSWQLTHSCYSACYHPSANDPSVTQSTPGSTFVNGQWRIVGHHWNDNMFPWNVQPSMVADASNSLIGYNYV